MKKYLALLLLIFISAGFTACAKKAVKTETGAAGAVQTAPVKPSEEAKPVEKAPQPESQPAATPSGAMPSEEKIMQAEKPKEAVAEAKPEMKGLQDIFFDYDRFYIRDDAKPALEENAKYLKANKNGSIVIEGHCDERGTSEYNMALGERRAQSVRKYLTDLGIDPAKISTISYGKEKPFCADHTEQCWQENRRARFVEK
ncbi:MAG: peptidoglycan-associated lipoprotein Pal [Deltaproteobacteria bacterium]|nr:peptidoglycan-associated lipoprotein Pal [Deltaproteobacteria bacterium]